MLLDDHDSFRQPLAFMLEREPDLAVVAEAGSLADAREALIGLYERGEGLDVAVVDLDLPDGSGTEFISELVRANRRALVLVLSAHSEQGCLARAIEAGAAGILHKSSRIGDITDAVRRLRAGEQLVSPQEVMEAIRLVSRERRESVEARRIIDEITPREKEVLQALADGLGDKEISERLSVSLGTTRTHMANILSKLEVQSRLQALVFALRHGIVRVD
ncbi:response regulator [Rubrobacter marinus]|uniref:Response regulator n=2 Tax=Rubrobacter marinus TaxID=2653852 RepID=A0A6G8Q3M2_9ACTN|nr:response regulator [Rubrobacter marinus]